MPSQNEIWEVPKGKRDIWESHYKKSEKAIALTLFSGTTAAVSSILSVYSLAEAIKTNEPSLFVASSLAAIVTAFLGIAARVNFHEYTRQVSEMDRIKHSQPNSDRSGTSNRTSGMGGGIESN